VEVVMIHVICLKGRKTCFWSRYLCCYWRKMCTFCLSFIWPTL